MLRMKLRNLSGLKASVMLLVGVTVSLAGNAQQGTKPVPSQKAMASSSQSASSHPHTVPQQSVPGDGAASGLEWETRAGEYWSREQCAQAAKMNNMGGKSAPEYRYFCLPNHGSGGKGKSAPLAKGGFDEFPPIYLNAPIGNGWYAWRNPATGRYELKQIPLQVEDPIMGNGERLLAPPKEGHDYVFALAYDE